MGPEIFQTARRTKNIMLTKPGASLVLEACSIYVMRGPARWNYQHSIPAIEKLHYSTTFRRLCKLRHGTNVTKGSAEMSSLSFCKTSNIP